MTYSPFSDIEKLIVEWLRSHEAVSEKVGTRIYTEIPARPTYPLVTVKRIGGIPPVKGKLDQARLQIDIWAEKKYTAREVASVVQAALYDLEDELVLNQRVSSVSDDLGLTWLPDPESGQPRYLFGVLVSVVLA